MNESVEEFLRGSGFRPEREMLVDAMRAFEDEAAKAVAGEPSSLRMIDSHLPGCVDARSLADRPVIVVDAGGTNLRVASVAKRDGFWILTARARR